MDKSRKWLKLDPDKEEECDSHAAYGLKGLVHDNAHV